MLVGERSGGYCRKWRARGAQGPKKPEGLEEPEDLERLERLEGLEEPKGPKELEDPEDLARLEGLDCLENFWVTAIHNLVKRVVAVKCSGNKGPYIPVNRTA